MLAAEAGSFRDKNNKVYYYAGEVLRGVSEEAFKNWGRLSQEPFYKKLVEGRMVVETALDTDDSRVEAVKAEGWSNVMHHERISFISYVYEWPFGMLKDAALLHLRILDRAMAAGWTLKDASPYNIQWMGTTPIFIDVTSFEPYRSGDPWFAYRQFCMLFLYPLMLRAYRKINYLPLLRSLLDGIDPVEAVKFFPATSLIRRGVFSHVYLHSRMQSRFSASTSKSAPKKAGMRQSESMVRGLIQSVYRLVSAMKLQDTKTTWSHYTLQHSYAQDSYEEKQAFIITHVGRQHWSTVWDIGCNTGNFSKLCEQNADLVVAIDGDLAAIEALYQNQKSNGSGKILPLIMDMANTSPSQGWQGTERKTLEARGKPDLLLCLALIHHIVISANIPLQQFVDWLRSLECVVIIEFVSPDDEMAQQLLQNKHNQYLDYNQKNFETLILKRFAIDASIELKEGDRKLYCLSPKNSQTWTP